LRISELNGNLTSVARYQGTICDVREFDYLLRKINDIDVPEVVTGLADARLDQVIGAVVVPCAGMVAPGAGTDAEKAESLRKHCRRTLAAYKVPRHFVFVGASDLPTTSTGKLQRNRLVELFPGHGD
jgi:fatty-acyl-CoA synthase